MTELDGPAVGATWSSAEAAVVSSRLRHLRLRRTSTTSWAESSRRSECACTITDANCVNGKTYSPLALFVLILAVLNSSLFGRFDLVRKLGQGTYGKVQLGINKETGQEVGSTIDPSFFIRV